MHARLQTQTHFDTAPVHACPGVKAEAKAVATLLPNIKDRQKTANGFKIMSEMLNDDKAAFEFLCPLQVRRACICMRRVCGLSCCSVGRRAPRPTTRCARVLLLLAAASRRLSPSAPSGPLWTARA
jgi:hypothetical protein